MVAGLVETTEHGVVERVPRGEAVERVAVKGDVAVAVEVTAAVGGHADLVQVEHLMVDEVALDSLVQDDTRAPAVQAGGRPLIHVDFAADVP